MPYSDIVVMIYCIPYTKIKIVFDILRYKKDLSTYCFSHDVWKIVLGKAIQRVRYYDK